MSGKTIGYARIASNMQGDKHGIDPQVEMLKAAGCSVVYTDIAVSGSSLDRPGLREARADLKSGDTLKVVRVDRIARSQSALVTFITDLDQNGIEIEAIEEPDAATVIPFRDA